MVAILEPDEEEKYLLALLSDTSGLDIAEFCWVDPESTDGCFRAWDFQWSLYRNRTPLQIDQNGRATGKTVGIEMRSFAFPFNYEGQEMLITAPELNHLRPIVDKVEARLLSRRFTREMMPISGKSKGIARQPHWQVRFTNGARILSRLPQRDGKGVKGSVRSQAMVFTAGGHKRAEDVAVGDLVLTHRNRWRPVAGVSRSTAQRVVINGGGYRGLEVSWNHRMLGRRNANPQRKVNLGEPTGVIVDDGELAERWYFGSPSVFPAADAPIPDWCRDDEALLALAGWYVAEGNQAERRIALTVRSSEVVALRELADRLGLGSGARHKHGGAWTVHVYGVGLASWLLEHFGQHAQAKRVPVWLLGADPLLQRSFLEAYLQGDGHRDELKGRIMAGTASEELALGVRFLGQALGYACSMSFVDPKPNAYCSAPRRSWRVTLRDSGRNVVSEAGWDWQKVRSVDEIADGDVVSIWVEEDHSFVADGLLHHNIHATCIEVDEGQDYPKAGWNEIVEARNSWAPNSYFRVHGVSNGVRDEYHARTQPGSGFYVHRFMGMHRPSWNEEERRSRIRQYGNSRQSPDYRRNVYGDHGDATNPLFVLARLTACCDLDPGSEYNTDVYKFHGISYEQIRSNENPEHPDVLQMLHLPGTHLSGWSQAKKGYSAFYGGMDVGLTNHPSEIMIVGRRVGAADHLDLLTRIQLRRIRSGDQKAVVAWLFEFYGAKLKAFAIDRGGLGFPIVQDLQNLPDFKSFGDRIYGWNFDEKVVTGFEDREMERDETMEDLAIFRPFVEHSSDVLRNEYVDTKRILLPDDSELINQFQGQTYTIKRGTGTGPYGKRSYSEGSFHALDGVRMAIGAKVIPPLERRLNEVADQEAVLDLFMV